MHAKTLYKTFKECKQDEKFFSQLLDKTSLMWKQVQNAWHNANKPARKKALAPASDPAKMPETSSSTLAPLPVTAFPSSWYRCSRHALPPAALRQRITRAQSRNGGLTFGDAAAVPAVSCF